MVIFPEKKEIFGGFVTPTTYEEAVALIIEAARQHQSAIIDYMPVHGLMLATEDKAFSAANKQSDMVCPDGQPVRWALNRFQKTGLKETVCGPTSTLKVCEAAAEHNIPVYFYGSTEGVLEYLRQNLVKKIPGLQIAGMESPPFRTLSAEEDAEMVQRVNASGAGIMFIGLGCPKQEFFALEHKRKINMPMLCVGAAFDFHAGVVERSPVWMSKCGLEWLYRLIKEPRRLLSRYLYYNTKYICSFLEAELFGSRVDNRELEARK